ncbi:MAG: hypothetical protein ACE5FV_07065 [Woeseia sp.]
MKLIIVVFGGLLCLAGLLILVTPDRFKNFMNGWKGQPRFLFAVIVRVLLGAVLLAEAQNLRFPVVMKIIGAIAILAAIVLLLVGQERTDRFIDWWMRMPDRALRSWSVFALAFGVFLIYVAV